MPVPTLRLGRTGQKGNAMLAERWSALSPNGRSMIAGAGLIVAYFATAAISMANFGTNTPIWFANALAVAWLLQLERRPALFSLGFIFLADTLAIFWVGGHPAPVLALADVGEIFVMTSLIRRIGGGEAALSSPAGLGKFILLCLVVPMFSATWGATFLTWSEGGDLGGAIIQWYGASALGLLVVCPALLIWFTPALRTDIRQSNKAVTLLLVALLGILALLVATFASPPLLLVLFPALLLLVWRSGLFGASLGTTILLIVGLADVLLDFGAFAALAHPATDMVSHIRAMQMYLGALTLSSLPLAVVLADQHRLLRELARLADARSDFLAAMSHEIRTPMTGVLGMVDLLDSEAPTPRQREQLGSIRASGRHLVNILNDILDFSRIETGKIDLERIDFSLPLLLEQVRNALQPLALERGIELSVGLADESPPIVRGDPTRIQQILLNLAGNAIKFTPEGSVLVLAAYCPDAAGPRFRFEVRDTGIGLAADQQLHIFSAFTQADHSTSRRYGGSGLGLAISKRLVDMMRGEIGVESTPGEGSLFWFEIPLEPGNVANLPAETSADLALIIPRRVLLAEDVELNRDIICTVLARDGHHVVVAENGSEAVERATEQTFDLILMDVHMPVMDGLDATRAIRALPGAAGTTPIIALTANVMASEQEKCRQAGMDSVLMKPVEWEKVRAVIRDCAKQRQSREGPLPAASKAEGAEEIAFDEAIFAEIGQFIPADRLQRHVDTLVAAVDQLAETGPATDVGQIRKLAHSITSQAGMLGLTRLSSCAAAIEEACDGGQQLPWALQRFRAVSADPSDFLQPASARFRHDRGSRRTQQ